MAYPPHLNQNQTMDILLSALLLPLLLLLNPSPTAADESNILVSGGVLPTDGQLSYDGNVFVIQDDCNLVLYNKGSEFASNTSGLGTKCTLTLSDHGELVIKSNNDSKVWSSSRGSIKGQYVAVLSPDGQVSVFGPAVWSTTPLFRSMSVQSSPPLFWLTSPAESKEDAEQANTLPVRNVLFSSQVLNGNSELASRDYTLAISDDCNLEFKKLSTGLKVWESKTKGKGEHCFLRLDHHGRLAVVDDRYKVLWSTKGAAEDGNYVLVVHIHEWAVVYGPKVWSTAS